LKHFNVLSFKPEICTLTAAVALSRAGEDGLESGDYGSVELALDRLSEPMLATPLGIASR